MIWWSPLIVAALLAAVIDGHFGLKLGISTEFFRVAALDILSVVAAIAAGLRLLSGASLNALQVCWLIFTCILAVSFVKGTLAFGLQAAGSYYRPFLYLTVFGSYALTFPWTSSAVDWFVRILLGTAALIAIMCLVLWVTPGALDLGFTDNARYAYQQRRVLPAASSFFLAQVGLIAIGAHLRNANSIPLIVMGVVCLFLVALLFHRSVWITALFGLAVLIIAQPRVLASYLAVLSMATLAVVAVSGAFAAFGGDLWSRPLQSAVAEVFSDQSSLDWRVTGWQILVERNLEAGIGTILFGAGFGVGYDRFIGLSEVDVAPHSLYVTLFINAGVLGVFAWAAFTAFLSIGLLRAVPTSSRYFSGPVGCALVAMMVFFGVPYNIPPEQGLLIGLLATIASHSTTRQSAGQTAHLRTQR